MAEEAAAEAADGHWSNVNHGESFNLTLRFDETFQKKGKTKA